MAIRETERFDQLELGRRQLTEIITRDFLQRLGVAGLLAARGRLRRGDMRDHGNRGGHYCGRYPRADFST